MKYVLIGLVCIAGLTMLSWGLQAAQIVSFGIQREAIQHSQPYVETKISLLHKLHNDWLQLDAEIAEFKAIPNSQAIINAKQSQQKSIVIRLREEAEPTGLFSSKNTDGTWVLFVDTNGDIAPIYTEHKVTTFPFAVKKSSDGSWVRADEMPSSFTITLKSK